MTYRTVPTKIRQIYAEPLGVIVQYTSRYSHRHQNLQYHKCVCYFHDDCDDGDDDMIMMKCVCVWVPHFEQTQRSGLVVS